MINNLELLYRVLDRPRVEKILNNKFGVSASDIIEYSWSILDDLDQVEFIMEIEKLFDIGISDELADKIIRTLTLSDFLNGIVSYNRGERLKELGI